MALIAVAVVLGYFFGSFNIIEPKTRLQGADKWLWNEKGKAVNAKESHRKFRVKREEEKLVWFFFIYLTNINGVPGVKKVWKGGERV